MIPIIRPDVSFAEVAGDFEQIIDSGQLTGGRFVAAFEAAIAERVGVEHAVTTTSATTALHLSLAALGIGPGDEVLVSDFTFPASGNVIVELGATPVLVDSATDSFALDVDLAAELVTERTKAIMPVHPFGQPADLDAIGRLATDHGLVVVEDAACALGSSWGDVACGSAHPGCFSFHPRKVVTTGEGGAITTDDSAFAARVRLLRSHGAVPAEVGMEFVANGFNARLGELPAALGLSQMTRLDDILADRRATGRRYDALLAGVPGVELRVEPPGQTWSYQSYVVMLDDEVDRDGVVSTLRSRGIETTLGTYAMHAHPAFQRFGTAAGDLPNSSRAQRRSLTLPLLPRMPEDTVELVVAELATAVEGASR